MVDKLTGFFAPYNYSLLKTKNGNMIIQDYYTSFVKYIIYYVLKGNPDDTLYSINIDYKDIFDINASATTLVEGRTVTDKIELHMGVILKCYQAMYNIVSIGDVLNKEQCLFIKKDKSISMKYNYGFQNHQKYNMDFLLPQSTHMVLADFLASLSIQFTLLHEIGHLFNGHVSLHNLLSNTELKYSMFSNDTKSSLSSLDYKTMEMDADAFAITNLIDHGYGRSINEKEINEVCRNFEDLIYLIIFSVNTLLLMVKDESSKEIASQSPTQLTYQNRVNFIIGSIKTNISKRYNSKISEKALDRVIEYALINSTTFFRYFYSKDPRWVFEEGDTSEYMNEVLNNWKQIRPRLTPFSRTILAE